MSTRAIDYTSTRQAEDNRDRKAAALAAEARRLGLMPFELRTVGGGELEASRRDAIRRNIDLDRAPSVETWTRAVEMLEVAAFGVPGIVMCAACDWPVLRERTVGGRVVELDPFPREDGSVHLDHDRHGVVVAVIYPGGSSDRPLDEPMYRQHARSCPSTAAGRRLLVRKCEVCGRPLWQPLADRDPAYTTHPTCHPNGELS